MSDRRRVLLIMAVTALLAFGVASGVMAILYRTAFTEESARLTEVVRSRARLLEAIEAGHPRPGSAEARSYTIRVLRAAHARFEGFGRTGEFTVGEREGDGIRFLLRHRHGETRSGGFVRDPRLAEPMWLALDGGSGQMVGRDYRGETVLAAYEAVPGLGLGVVAKIDLAEVRAPFVRAGAVAAVLTLLLMGLSLGTHGVLVGRVVEDRLAAEEGARISEARFRVAFDEGGVGMALLDASGAFLDVNARLCEMLGYSRADLCGKSAFDVTHPDDLALSRELRERVLGGGGRPDMVRKRYLRADGRVVHALVALIPAGPRDQPSLSFLAQYIDVTHERMLQERLLQAEKMEAVGQLAGGVAHDFNNLLTVICGNASLLLEAAPSDALREIESAAAQGAALTAQLLAFARRSVVQPRRVDLDAVVSGWFGVLVRLIGDDVAMRFDPGGAGPVVIDPAQVHQVLMNLCSNARDAMPGGGRVVIATREDELAAGRGDAPPGRYVVLSVDDDGVGMSRETLARAFEPFFTTKARGSGTGLGLATVHGIALQAGGFVEVRSVEGEGACIEVWLPRSDGPVSPPDAPPAPPPRSRGERVLVVEDEASIRRLVARILEKHGFDVRVAACPEEALRIPDDADGGFALLVTDLVMPGMGGQELARRLRGRSPGLPVLFVSGYAHADAFSPGEPGCSFLAKPFSPTQLVASVRAALDGPATGAPVATRES